MMAHLQRKPPTFDTFEAFLDWQGLQDTNHELIGGVARAMTGTSESDHTL